MIGPAQDRKLVRAFVVLVGAYISAQLLANVGSLKITTLFGLAVDAGTIIYPITFTLRDLLHKRLGMYTARVTIFASAIVNLFMSAYFALVCALPSDPSWNLGAEFAATLNPAWRIVMASIIAMVASELVDTEVYHVWTKKVTVRFQWTRVLVSNAVSIPIDSVLFSWIAFAFVLDSGSVWAIFWSNVWIKAAVTLLSLPMIYLVKPGQTGERA